jgi:N-acetylglucosamine kinase-like BadF-type ATPase
MLGGLMEKLAAAAGTRIPGRPLARHLCACVANADLPEEEELVAAALRAQGWTVTTSVVNDTFAVLRAGLADENDGADSHWGVAVTCGAGINCVGVAPDGRIYRFLALGSKSGDWGGGFGLGRAAVWWAIRDEDGRGEPTALREAVPAHFGLAAMHDVAVAMQREAITDDDVAGLAPVLFTCANRGDRVALDLVSRQADEVCAMALAAMGKLGLTSAATPVVLGGGLMTAREPLLTTAIMARLAAEAPRSAPLIIDVPPIAGAALLGLDQVRAAPGAHARLRAAYAPARILTPQHHPPRQHRHGAAPRP